MFRGERLEFSEPRFVVIWLATTIVMVAIMMVIGAITRLTESGLSMVEWRPLSGTFPPFSIQEWERVFALYKETSEYKIENEGMSLTKFKTIFWWEYIHRLWGRLIGIVFTVPLIWFVWTRTIVNPLRLHLTLVLMLGALQGLIGWWMVKSGLVDRHDVSQYRLMVHLSLAFFILGYLLWLTANLLVSQGTPRNNSRCIRFSLNGTVILIYLTVICGSLVAGLGAGYDYNTWPLMDGSIIPGGIYLSTWDWNSLFEDIRMVQFNHRILAYITLATVLVVAIFGYREARSLWQQMLVSVLVIVVILQICLGIVTLLSVIALPFAVLHQVGAIILFSIAVLTRHAFR